MKKFFSALLACSVAVFAQDALRTAIDEGDIATAKKMVKAGEIEEIYCGKLSPQDAANIYAPIFKSAPEMAFEQCPNQFSYGYGEKVCASKSMTACSDVLQLLEMDGVAGNSNAIVALGKTLKVALSNGSFKKPVKEQVDTLLWQPCPKKKAEACVEACVNYAETSGDTTRLAGCKAKPEELVEKTITVSKPSPLYEKHRAALLESYWSSPFGVSIEFAKLIAANAKALSIPDTAVPNQKYVVRWVEAHKADGTPLPGGQLFRFCAAWQPFVDSLLTAKELNTHCPVFEKFVDVRDNNEYKVKAIAGNDWMVENLKFAAEGSACYDGDEGNCKTFGRLYPQAVALNVCPEGFHLSTEEDWAALIELAGGSSLAAVKLRSNGSDDFAFSAMFGGYVNKNNISTTIGEGAYFWTEGVDGNRAVARSMFSTDNDVSRITVDPAFSLSVRCVRPHVPTAEEAQLNAFSETPAE